MIAGKGAQCQPWQAEADLRRQRVFCQGAMGRAVGLFPSSCGVVFCGNDLFKNRLTVPVRACVRAGEVTEDACEPLSLEL